MCVISKFVSIREFSSFTKKKQYTSLPVSTTNNWHPYMPLCLQAERVGVSERPSVLSADIPMFGAPRKKNINYAEVLNPTPKPSDLI
jgi:hypothetical protein